MTSSSRFPQVPDRPASLRYVTLKPGRTSRWIGLRNLQPQARFARVQFGVAQTSCHGGKIPCPIDVQYAGVHGQKQACTVMYATSMFVSTHYTRVHGKTRLPRLATAEKYVKNFSIATECGFGRRPRDTISELLAIHAAAAD